MNSTFRGVAASAFYPPEDRLSFQSVFLGKAMGKNERVKENGQLISLKASFLSLATERDGVGRMKTFPFSSGSTIQ